MFLQLFLWLTGLNTCAQHVKLISQEATAFQQESILLCDPKADTMYLYVVNGNYYIHNVKPHLIFENFDTKMVKNLSGVDKSETERFRVFSKKMASYVDKIAMVLLFETKGGATPPKLMKDPFVTKETIRP